MYPLNQAEACSLRLPWLREGLVYQNILSGRGFGRSCRFSLKLSTGSSVSPGHRAELEGAAERMGLHAVLKGKQDSGKCLAARLLGKELMLGALFTV